MLLAMGSVRPLDRLHSEIRKINAPTIQWFQLARPNGVKPGAQGTTKSRRRTSLIRASSEGLDGHCGPAWAEPDKTAALE